jgi:hypothetical protein
MKRFSMLLGFCALHLALAGCGPMRTPMAVRLDGEGQKKFDESWDKAFAELDKIDHQELLDIFIGTGAYQIGVDKLDFRSEKKTAGGLVVMEVHFNRATPAEDRFEVSAFDPAGNRIRHERYGREEVERTHAFLFGPQWKAPENGMELPGFAEKRAEFQARWGKALRFFPKDKDEGPFAKGEENAKK